MSNAGHSDDWLSGLLADRLNGRVGEVRECHTLLSEMDIVAVLRGSLALAKTDATYLARSCRRSYRHPNGFTKLELRRGPGWALRLHVWQEPVPVEQNDLHDHCGSLTSLVAKGRVRNEEYLSETDGRATRYLRYRDHLVNSTHLLTEVGERELSPAAVDEHGAGTAYALAGDVIHRTVPVPPFPAVTLVLEGRRLRQFSNVYRRHRRRDVENVPVTCKPALFHDTIEAVLRAR